MLITCGDFPVEVPESQESLTISLSGHTRNVKVRARNISLSANYLADYMAAFVALERTEGDINSTRAELWDALSFIANELLENALKFHFNPEREISLRLAMDASSAMFVLVNTVDPATVVALTSRFGELLSQDPAELYVERLERSAAAGKNSSSGLGLLTMLNDYGARLSWRFESPEEDTVVTLTTLVQLTI